MTMDIAKTAAELFDRQDTERIALAEAHLRERSITTRQALVEMWAAENRERTVTRRYQGLALAKIEAEQPWEASE
jgi:CRP-like cAMP-binding protein